jgi:hypothetical protein
MKKTVDIALEYLLKAQKEIYEQCPPPYEFPSDNGRVAQLISDAINTATIIKNKATN